MEFSSVINVIVQTILNYPIFFGIVFALPIIAILRALFTRQRNWCRAKNPAIILAILASIGAFFGLPILFKSNLSNMSYAVDWIFHGLCVFGVFVYVFFVVWFFFSPSRD